MFGFGNWVATSGLAFVTSVVIELGYVHTKVGQEDIHGGDERRPQVDQALNIWKRIEGII